MDAIYEELTVIDDSAEDSQIDDLDEKYGHLNLADFPDDEEDIEASGEFIEEFLESNELQRSPFDIYIKLKRMTLFKVHEFVIRIDPKQPIIKQIQTARSEFDIQILQAGFKAQEHELRSTLKSFYADPLQEADTTLHYRCELYKAYQS
jgi:hypothetical protein